MSHHSCTRPSQPHFCLLQGFLVHELCLDSMKPRSGKDWKCSSIFEACRGLAQVAEVKKIGAKNWLPLGVDLVTFVPLRLPVCQSSTDGICIREVPEQLDPQHLVTVTKVAMRNLQVRCETFANLKDSKVHVLLLVASVAAEPQAGR